MGEISQIKWPGARSLVIRLAGLGLFTSLAYARIVKPIWAIVSVLLWQAFVSVFTQIWGRIEKIIVEILIVKIDAFIRSPFAGSRYRRRYFEHLTQRYLHLDVKGLGVQSVYSLHVEHVYVDLSIDPGLPDRDTVDPVHKSTTTGRHNIWAFLSMPELKTQNFAVIGAPGSGKTTLLKHVTLSLAGSNGKSHRLQYIPVLLFFRDLSDSICSSSLVTLAEIISDSASKMGIPAPQNWFRRQLESGKCLVMLDGLDEVADQKLRAEVARWVEEQMKRYGNNRFLLTSRPFGYKSNPLTGVTVLEVRPFNLEQVKLFINRWYLANEKMAAGEGNAKTESEAVRIAAREGASQLWERLHNKSALVDLAVNPLLLTMITTVHKYRGSLPGRRVELYTEICDAFLGKRQQARGMNLELTPAQKKRVLQPLAFNMMCNEKRNLKLDEAAAVIAAPLALVSPRMTCKQFLQSVEESSGLLLERENGLYSFAHLTFQEYLAAIHILEERIPDQLLTKVNVPWWHETILLYVALGDGSPIINACLSMETPSSKVLTLAIECTDEARTVEPKLRETVNEIVVSGVEDRDPERRHMAAEAILNRRLRQMVRLDEDQEFDQNPLSQAEYQYFLDVERSRGRWTQPDHWTKSHFPSGTAAEPVLGVRLNDAMAFCEWLSQRDNGDWHYRLPGADVAAGDGRFWTSDGAVKGGGGTQRVSALSTRDLVAERLENDRSVLSRGKLRLLAARAGDIGGQIHRFTESNWWTRLSDLRDRPVDLGRDLDRIFTLELDEKFDLNRARDLERRLERERNLSRARNIDRFINRDTVYDLVHYFEEENREQREFLRQFKRVEKFGRLIDKGNLAEPIDWGRKLARTLKQERNLDRLVDFGAIFGGVIDAGPPGERNPDLDRKMLRAAFRIIAMYLVLKLSKTQDPNLLSRSERRHLKEIGDKTKKLCDAFLDSYISLLILEERHEGRFRPIEGIRLLRVRDAEKSRRSAAAA